MDVFELNSTGEYEPYAERIETYLVPAIFLCIFVVGVVGNGILIVILFRHKELRSIPNTYIFSLALGDLLVVTTCVPFTSMLYTLESWPWGSFVCKISETTKNIGIGVSVFTLTALAADRYFAVASPLHTQQVKLVSILNASAIWLLAAVLSIPDAMFARLVNIRVDCDKVIIICSPFPALQKDEDETTYKKFNVLVKAMVYYFIPLAIIAVFYILAAIKLYQSSLVPGNCNGLATSQANIRRHVARMVLIFVLLFALCFFPHHLFILWFHLSQNAEEEYNDMWHVVKISGFCLSYINSCVNPVALYCGSRVFRPYFNKYLYFKSSLD